LRAPGPADNCDDMRAQRSSVFCNGTASRGALVFLFALLALAMSARAAGATTFTVTTMADTAGTCTAAGPCSLRQAITSAADGDTITVPAGGYTLDASNGQLVVTHGVTIDGAGLTTTTIDGDGVDRVLLIAGNATTATLRGLTITGGASTEAAGGGLSVTGPGPVVLDGVSVTENDVVPATGGFNEGGGGIFSQTNLTLNDSTVSVNTSMVGGSQGDSGGGGILVGEGGGNLTLNDSTVSQNTALVTADTAAETTDNNGGGGIYMDGQDIALTDSTVSNNTVRVTGSLQPGPADGGGGIYQFGDNLLLRDSTVASNSASGPGVAKGGGGGVFDGGDTSQYLDSTIAENGTDEPAATGATDSDGGGGVLLDNLLGGVVMANMTITGNGATAAAGGGINNNLGTDVEITDSIVAGNISSVGGANCDSQPASNNAIISEGFNLTNDSSCGFAAATSDIVSATPGVASLGHNGGPAETEALLAGSRAIDAGNPAGCTDLAGQPLTTDERGVARPQPAGGRCDIGAYERALPAISSSDAAVTGTTVLFGAMVGDADPRDGAVSFEYGPTTAYGSVTAAQTLPGGSGPLTFISSASRLAPGTYHFRAVATDPDGQSLGPDMTFKILAPPPPPSPPSLPPSQPPSSQPPTARAPTVTLANPTHVGAYTGTLNGTVNPEGEAATAQFQYGATTSFASHTTSSSVGAGTTGKTISAPLTGLLPGHVYHVRLVASSSAGSTASTGSTFKTAASRKPVGFAAKATPRVAAHAPFRFRVSGRLALPTGLTPAVGCKGAVSVQALVGKSNVGRAHAKLGRTCGYVMQLTLNASRLAQHRSARLVVSFGGNPALAKGTSRPLLVRFGAS
jgi:CSLREA domain-containing protein